MKHFLIYLALVFLLLGCAIAIPPVVVRIPPPEPITEAYGPPPHPEAFWIPGHWYWEGGRWVWGPGNWANPPRPGLNWVPGHWAPRGEVWVWHPGHWR